MAKDNGMTKINVAKLEVRVDDMRSDIAEIKSNHLPHIYDRISSMEKKIAYWSGGVGVVLLVVQLILSQLKK